MALMYSFSFPYVCCITAAAVANPTTLVTVHMHNSLHQAEGTVGRKANAGRGRRGSSPPPATQQLWLKPTQVGHPLTLPYNSVLGESSGLSLPSQERNRQGMVVESATEGVEQGVKVTTLNACSGESLPGLPGFHIRRHGCLLCLKLSACCHTLPLTLAMLDDDIHRATS